MDRSTSTVTVDTQFQLQDKARNYNHQYFSLYEYRFRHLKPRVVAAALAKWGDGSKRVPLLAGLEKTIIKQDKILDIKSGEVCWVVGNIFCELKNKLNILKDVEHGIDDVLPKEPPTYVSEEVIGAVMIEDELGRVLLHGDDILAKNLLVTGCIVGILGVEINPGVFDILDIVYPTPVDAKPVSGSGERTLVVLGLGMSADDDLRAEMLKQYILGDFSEADAQISLVIVLGDSVVEAPPPSLDDFSSSNNFGLKNVSRYDSEVLAKFDHWLGELVALVPIMVVPGDQDPAEICWPQQPLHRGLFPGSGKVAGFQRLTNPQYLKYDLGATVLLSSGQNIDDVIKYVDTKKDVLEVMQSNLKWLIIAPTAPDTLYCYPYQDFDPFVISSPAMAPNVYIVGNQSKFATMKTDRNVTLVLVPKFSKTGECVVVDMVLGECEVLKFGIEE